MKRHLLDIEIDRLREQLPELQERFGRNSKEARFALARLQARVHDRMMRDTGFRKRKYRRAA